MKREDEITTCSNIVVWFVSHWLWFAIGNFPNMTCNTHFDMHDFMPGAWDRNIRYEMPWDYILWLPMSYGSIWLVVGHVPNMTCNLQHGLWHTLLHNWVNGYFGITNIWVMSLTWSVTCTATWTATWTLTCLEGGILPTDIEASRWSN